MFNEWALQEYGQRDDINWLGIDGKSLKNTRKNPNNEQQDSLATYLKKHLAEFLEEAEKNDELQKGLIP